MDKVSLRPLTAWPRADIISAAVAHPTETIKCKLQLQLVQPAHVPKQFAGPIDVIRQTVQGQGLSGMWKGVGASFIYRSCFAAMFGGTSDSPKALGCLGWRAMQYIHS